jgi:molybdate transport system ATP-binding protein
MSLRLDLAVRLGTLDLAVALDAPAGAVTAVLGPNGAGKTTLLRCVAGHVAIDRGSIRLGGTTLDEPPATFVPPERRRLGLVHQDLLLFPHLTVAANVAFGPRAQGRPADEARATAQRWLERLGVADLADAQPAALSGGQAQRVALARALATEPDAVLLDEPLSALDAGVRAEVRRDLGHVLRQLPGPTLLVTHDPVDALALADHVAVLEHGRPTQVGTLAEVTARPRSRYVADLIGTNLVHGTARGTTIEGNPVEGTAGGPTLTLTTADPLDGAVFATIAPAAIAVHRHEPQGSPRNRWQGTVAHLDLLGDRVRVHVGAPVDLTAEVTPAAAAELALHEGQPVWLSAKATEVHAYPR